MARGRRTNMARRYDEKKLCVKCHLVGTLLEVGRSTGSEKRTKELCRFGRQRRERGAGRDDRGADTSRVRDSAGRRHRAHAQD